MPRGAPAYSPESNHMAESFVKTFKHDYVCVNELHDAESVMRQLTGWLDDCDEVHPHKGLRMPSPREYRRATANAQAVRFDGGNSTTSAHGLPCADWWTLEWRQLRKASGVAPVEPDHLGVGGRFPVLPG